MAFNVEQALKDGLSEEEVADHLSKTRNYNLKWGLDNGYSHREIIDYLAPQKPIGEPPISPVAPTEPKPSGVGVIPGLNKTGNLMADIASAAEEVRRKEPVIPRETVQPTVQPEIKAPRIGPVYPPGFFRPNLVTGGERTLPKPAPLVEPEKAPITSTPTPQPQGTKGYGLRPDGTPKGSGFLGELKTPSGQVATEYSIGVNLNGKETLIPGLVPTLTKEEIDYLLKSQTGHPEILKTPIGQQIFQKAVEHAKGRLAKGLSPFAQEGEQIRANVPTLKPQTTLVNPPFAARHPYLAAIPPTLLELPREVVKQVPYGKYFAGEEPTGTTTDPEKLKKIEKELMTQGTEPTLLGIPKELKGEFLPTGTTTDPEKLKEIEKELVTGEKRISPYESLAKETMTALEWLAFPTGMRTAGAIAKEVLPASVTRFFTTPIGAWFKSLTNKERGLMVQSIPDMINKGYSEGEILRRWTSSSWREEALNRRNKGEEFPEFKEAGKPEVSKTAQMGEPLKSVPQESEPIGSTIPSPGQTTPIATKAQSPIRPPGIPAPIAMTPTEPLPQPIMPQVSARPVYRGGPTPTVPLSPLPIQVQPPVVEVPAITEPIPQPIPPGMGIEQVPPRPPEEAKLLLPEPQITPEEAELQEPLPQPSTPAIPEEGPTGYFPSEQWWNKTPMELQEAFDEINTYYETMKAKVQPEMDRLQKEYKSIKGKGSQALKEAVKDQLTALEDTYASIIPKAESGWIDENLKHQSEAETEAKKAGISDDDMENFLTDYGMAISTERPYYETNYNKPIRQIFNELVEEYTEKIPKTTEEANIKGQQLTKEEAIATWEEYKRNRDELTANPPEDLQEGQNRGFKNQILRETVEAYLGATGMTSLTPEEIEKGLYETEPEAKIGGEKQPWEMTKAEYLNSVVDQLVKDGMNRKDAEEFGTTDITTMGVTYGPNSTHRQEVNAALSEGRPVPPEVLADYPELAPKASKEEVKKPAEKYESPWYDLSDESHVPWEMPVAEWQKWQAYAFGDEPKPVTERVREWHKGQVLGAKQQGLPVPEEVLAEHSLQTEPLVSQEVPKEGVPVTEEGVEKSLELDKREMEGVKQDTTKDGWNVTTSMGKKTGHTIKKVEAYTTDENGVPGEKHIITLVFDKDTGEFNKYQSKIEIGRDPVNNIPITFQVDVGNKLLPNGSVRKFNVNDSLDEVLDRIAKSKGWDESGKDVISINYTPTFPSTGVGKAPPRVETVTEPSEAKTTKKVEDWSTFTPNEFGYQERDLPGLKDGYWIAQYPNQFGIIESKKGSTKAIVTQEEKGKWKFQPEVPVIGKDKEQFKPIKRSFDTPQEALLEFNRYKDIIDKPEDVRLHEYQEFGKPETHKTAVYNAVNRGESPEGLMDYPDLAKQTEVSPEVQKAGVKLEAEKGITSIPTTDEEKAIDLVLMSNTIGKEYDVFGVKADGTRDLLGSALVSKGKHYVSRYAGLKTKRTGNLTSDVKSEYVPLETYERIEANIPSEVQKAEVVPDISDIPQWVLDKPKTVLRRAGVNKQAIAQMSEEDARKFAVEEYRDKKEQLVNFVSGFGEITEEVGPEPAKPIPYTKDLKITNLDQLPRGTGTRYLEAIPGEGNTFIAKQWRRSPVYPEGSVLIDMGEKKTLTKTIEPTLPPGVNVSKPGEVPRNRKIKGFIEEQEHNGVSFIVQKVPHGYRAFNYGDKPIMTKDFATQKEAIAEAHKIIDATKLSLPPGTVTPQEAIEPVKEVVATRPPGIGKTETSAPIEKTKLMVRPSVYRDKTGFTVWGTIQGKTDQKLFFERKADADEFVKRVKAGEDSGDVSSEIFGRSKKIEEVAKPELIKGENLPNGFIVGDPVIGVHNGKTIEGFVGQSESKDHVLIVDAEGNGLANLFTDQVSVKEEPPIETKTTELPPESTVESKPLKWADLSSAVQKNIPEELTDLRTEPYFGTQVIKGEKPAQYNPDKLITYTYDAKTGQELGDWELGKIRAKVEDEKEYEAQKAKISALPDVEGKKIEPAKEITVKTQKDQKKYLIDSIDEAIKQAPDKEVEPVLLSISRKDTESWRGGETISKPIMEKTPHVIIEVPGDGTFRVINSKKALTGFKEAAEKRFPATEAAVRPPGMGGIKIPPEKPSGRRISPKENADYEYITEYSPKRVSEADYDTAQNALVGEGWFTTGHYMIKGEPPTGFGKKATNIRVKELTKEMIDNVTPSLKDMSPATHVAEFHVMGATGNTGIAINDKGSAYFQTALMDVIRKHQPDAILYIKDAESPMAFVKDKEVVGILMPMRPYEDPTGLVEKYFADQGIKAPWEKEVVKEEVKAEVAPTIEEPLPGITDQDAISRMEEQNEKKYMEEAKAIEEPPIEEPIEDLTPSFSRLKELEKEWKEYDVELGKLRKEIELLGSQLARAGSSFGAHGLNKNKLATKNEMTGQKLEAEKSFNELLQKRNSVFKGRDVEEYDFKYYISQGEELPPERAKLYPDYKPTEPSPKTKAGIPEKKVEEVAPQKTEGKKPWEMTKEEYAGKEPVGSKTPVWEVNVGYTDNPAGPLSGKEKIVSMEKPKEGDTKMGAFGQYVVKSKTPKLITYETRPAYDIGDWQSKVEDHQVNIKRALTSGDLTPAEYTRLHEKNYGKIEEFVPELTEKVEKGGVGEKVTVTQEGDIAITMPTSNEEKAIHLVLMSNTLGYKYDVWGVKPDGTKDLLGSALLAKGKHYVERYAGIKPLKERTGKIDRDIKKELVPLETYDKIEALVPRENIDYFVSKGIPLTEVISDLQTSAKGKEGVAEPEKISDFGKKIAERLRTSAESLTKQIQEKRNPAVAQQNVTARRANQTASAYEEADHLENLQNKLNALADAHETGNIPKSLKEVTTKTQVENIMRHSRFPNAHLHRAWIEDILKATKGKPGTAQDREILSRVMGRDEYGGSLHGDKEISAAENLIKIAEKAGEKSPWAKDSISEHKRMLFAGIDTEEKFLQAKNDLKELGKKPIDRSKEQKIRTAEQNLLGRKIPGYWPTPKATAERLVEEADIQPGMTVLEPSAGKGNIADVIKEQVPDANLKTIEWQSDLSDILKLKGYDVIGRDFLEHTGQYDRIVMNPPFENLQDVDHVRHAYDHLNPSGRLVSIMSESPFFRSDKKAVEFRDWLESIGGTSEKLPEKSFAEKSERATGVSGRIVVIDKPSEKKLDKVREKGVQYIHERKIKENPDLQAREGGPDYPKDEVETVFPEVISSKSGTYDSGLSHINSASDAAHIGTINLNENPQEHFISIVTDKNDKIISIYRHSIGIGDASLVDPKLLIGQALNTPNAKNIWLIHNHPSGSPTFSPEDMTMNMDISNLSEESGINARDFVSVGAEKFDSASGGKGDIPDIKPYQKIDFVERKFKKHGVAKAIRDESDLKDFTTKFLPEGGFILVNNQQAPVSTIGIKEFASLRGEKQNLLLKEIEKRNARHIFIYEPSRELSLSEINNLFKFGNAANLGVIDILDKSGSRRGKYRGAWDEFTKSAGKVFRIIPPIVPLAIPFLMGKGEEDKKKGYPVNRPSYFPPGLGR